MKAKLTASLLLASTWMIAQDPHHKAVDQRGDHLMGFLHEKATHHFRLFADGGAIEVTANNPKDGETCDQIRTHLYHIERMFTAGNFQAPMLIHDRVPPGVPVLQKLKSAVSYRYEEIESGGRVRISTRNKEALSAVHDFLKFQITDHRTGDATKVPEEPAAAK